MSILVQKPALTSSCRVAAQILAVTIFLVMVCAILTGYAFFQILWWGLLMAGAIVGLSMVIQAFSQGCHAYAWWKLFRVMFSIIMLVIVYTNFT